MNRYILAITGASGPVLGLRVLSELARNHHVFVTVSSGAFAILKEETSLDLKVEDPGALLKERYGNTIDYFDNSNLHAPISSGSFQTDGMLIVPCSMKTLSSIANGFAGNLIERSADVTIKEGRPLIISPREMPFSSIHLENMLKLSRLGVKIAPPVPAFYHNPVSLDDMLDFLAGRILDTLRIENNLFNRWTGM